MDFQSSSRAVDAAEPDQAAPFTRVVVLGPAPKVKPFTGLDRDDRRVCLMRFAVGALLAACVYTALQEGQVTRMDSESELGVAQSVMDYFNQNCGPSLRAIPWPQEADPQWTSCRNENGDVVFRLSQTFRRVRQGYVVKNLITLNFEDPIAAARVISDKNPNGPIRIPSRRLIIDENALTQYRLQRQSAAQMSYRLTADGRMYDIREPRPQ